MKIQRFCFLWFLCVSSLLLHGQSSAELEKALSAAGSNQNELRKVLTYYAENESDSLKWKAACFLIEHMPAHYTYTGDAIDRFYLIMGNVFDTPRDLGRAYYTQKYDSVFSVLGHELPLLQVRPDVRYITADYLIRNIDDAFRMWQTPWARHYSFDTFCEYILPYRAGAEPLTDWRPLFINRKPSELDLLGYSGNTTYVYGMCNSLNQKFTANLYYPSGFMPEYPLGMLYQMKSGSCRDYSNLGVAQMRALGIPVAIDFVPQWGRRSMGHEWNVLVVSEGVSIPFAVNDALGHHLYTYFEEAFTKVYRKTYQRQKESLFYCSGDEAIPVLFDTPCLKDVTTEYLTEVKDIETTLFELPDTPKFAYLSAFDNSEWQIVQWGKVEGNKVTFHTMGAECVYLPVRYQEDGRVNPVSWPVLCSMEGDRLLIPDTGKKESLRLTRKYRTSRNLIRCAERVKGGRFQVANKKDFSDSVTVHVISGQPECAFQKVELDYAGKYSYFRYLAPAESWCNMAEIELYGADGERLTTDRVFSVDGGNKGYEDYKCFDGDVLTYYNAQWNPHHGWIAVEFPTPVHLSSLYYLPRNDDNFIRQGELYELFYWDKAGWVSLGQKKGVKESVLVYDDAPGNALFLLRNLTRGKEERIFTYENGIQRWW